MAPPSIIDLALHGVSQNKLLFGLLGLAYLGKAVWSIFRPRIKGFAGEGIVNMGALQKLDPTRYKSFNDIYLPRPEGDGTTQVDHVVVSVHGIFVVETKNYAGWIFGSSGQAEWLQIIKGGKKIRFQNPLRQNWLHLMALASELDLPKSVFHPIVYFAGESTFKSHMPDNVMRSGLKTYIEDHEAVILANDVVTRVNEHLARLNAPGAKRRARKDHVAGIKRRIAAGGLPHSPKAARQ